MTFSERIRRHRERIEHEATIRAEGFSAWHTSHDAVCPYEDGTHEAEIYWTGYARAAQGQSDSLLGFI